MLPVPEKTLIGAVQLVIMLLLPFIAIEVGVVIPVIWQSEDGHKWIDRALAYIIVFLIVTPVMLVIIET